MIEIGKDIVVQENQYVDQLVSTQLFKVNLLGDPKYCCFAVFAEAGKLRSKIGHKLAEKSKENVK